MKRKTGNLRNIPRSITFSPLHFVLYRGKSTTFVTVYYTVPSVTFTLQFLFNITHCHLQAIGFSCFHIRPLLQNVPVFFLMQTHCPKHYLNLCVTIESTTVGPDTSYICSLKLLPGPVVISH